MKSVLYARSRAVRSASTRSLQPRFALTTLSLFLFAFNGLHAEWKKKPAVQISFPNYALPREMKSLRSLEFRNSQAVFFDEKGVPDFRAALHDGKYERRDKIGGESVAFSWLTILGNDSTDPNTAIAYYTWVTSAGSASDFGVVQLLHLEDGRLKVIQQILFNTRGSEKAGAFFNARSEVLTVRALNEWEHCCPTGLDVVGFRLKGGLLKRVSYEKAALE